MNVIKTMGKSGLLLLTGVLAGIFLLAVAFCIPVNQENAAASFEILEKEGWYPVANVLSRETDTYFHSYLPGVMDDSTDRIIVYTALDTQEGNPFVRAMKMYNGWQNQDYAYYWHGYVTLLRPLLFVFDLGELRLLNGAGQLLLIFFCMLEIWKRKKRLLYVLALFTSYLLLMPMATAMCLQYTWIFYITFGGCLALLKGGQFFERNHRYLYFFLLLGMLTSFFDLLTYPLLTWGFPLIWYLLVGTPEENAGRRVKKTVLTGIFWIAGYGLMWAGKWLAASAILQRNVFESAFREVLLRSGMETQAQWGIYERLEAVYANWKHYEYKVYFLVLAVWLAACVIVSIAKGFRAKPNSWVWFLIGLSPVVWYLVLSDHTQGHHLFTYRIFGISVLAFLAMALECVFCMEEETGSAGKKFVICIFWGLFAVAGLGAACMAREDILAINGGAPVEDVALPEGEVLEASFTPTFTHIVEMGFGIKSQSREGTCEFSLEKDGEEIYHLSAPITDFQKISYCSFPVDWRLDSQTPYTLKVWVQGIDEEVYAVVTQEGEMVLTEYGALSVGEDEMESQLVTGITYRARPMSRQTLLFLTLTWMAVAACAAASLYGLKQK